MLVEALINGFVIGAIYALISSGLSLIYGVMRVINVSHSEMLMVGGYLVIILVGWVAMPVALAVAASLLIMFLLGFGIDRLLIRPFRERNQSEDEMLLSTVVVTLGLSFILSNLVFALMGADVRRVPPLVGGRVTIAGIPISGHQILTIVLTFVAIAGLIFLLAKTRVGLALRGVSQNADAAQVVGVNRTLMYGLAFAIGAGLAALSGILMGPIYFLFPFMGLAWIIRALIIVIAGGLGSIEGALIASFGLAMVESILGTFVSVHAGTVAFFVVVVLVLLFRPRGLFPQGGQLL